MSLKQIKKSLYFKLLSEARHGDATDLSLGINLGESNNENQVRHDHVFIDGKVFERLKNM